MSWIDAPLKRSIIIISGVFLSTVLVVNPYTLSWFDSNPPLSSTIIFLMYSTYFLSIFLAVLFLFFRNLAIQISVALITLIIFELVVSLFVNRAVDQKQFRLTQPEPYVDADYYSHEFIDESFSQPGGWILDAETGGVKPKNFEGVWFNVENHRRRTVNVADESERRIYIFGGSAVYSSEVPDSLTIASQLAQIIPQDLSIEVINLGATSIHSTQQLGRLKSEVNLNRGDLVVFYDGVNDVLQRILYNNQRGFMHGVPDENILISTLRLFKGYSSIAHLFFDQLTEKERVFSSEHISISVENYISTLHETNEYVERNGTYFFHFLQPTLFTKSVHNEYELSLISMGDPFVPVQVAQAFALAYPVIEENLAGLPFSTSLTSAFDGMEQSPYLDAFHVNHIGNRIIAESIWNRLSSHFK